MSKPLALLCYSNLLPGGQLSARLQDMGYRTQVLSDAATLQETCEREKPLVVLAEILPPEAVCAAIARVRNSPATSHVPVLGFSALQDKALQTAAELAGVSLLAGNTAVLEHLPQLLDQVLQV